MNTTMIGGARETSRKLPCAHYWVIEPPDGLVSPGTCKLCGEERTFKNHITASDWTGPDSSESIPSDSSETSGADVRRVPQMDDEDVLVF